MRCVLLRSCLEKTTAHGIPYIAGGRTIVQRLIWAVIVLAAFGAFGYYFSQSVMKYYSEPISIQMDSRSSKFIPPDLHVCNIRSLSYSRLMYQK
jgi:hypothetical protein